MGPDARAVGPPSPDVGGRAPEDDPRRCTATNRRGERCSRWAAPGKTVCHNHGARSTGPRTAGGRLRNVAAKLKHGGRATSDAYKAALRQAHPQLFDSGGGAPDVGRELAFARAKLGALALDPSTPLDEIARLLDVVRRLADVQASNARDVARDGSALPQVPPEPMTLRLTVVNAPAAPATNAPTQPPTDDPVDPPARGDRADWVGPEEPRSSLVPASAAAPRYGRG